MSKKYIVLNYDGSVLNPSSQLHHLFVSNDYCWHSNDIDYDFIIIYIYYPEQLYKSEYFRNLFKCLSEQYIKNVFKPIVFTTQLIGFEDRFEDEKIKECPNFVTKTHQLESKNSFLSALINPNIWIRTFDLSELKNDFDTCVSYN